MSVMESCDYQAAREGVKGNPGIAMMTAGVVTVPLAELAYEDGTPAPPDEQGLTRACQRRCVRLAARGPGGVARRSE
jgi:hypothetical protein